jgi:hypothetical protein
VHCALALTPEALERWRRLRDPAVRAVVGDPCPLCRGRLEDADAREPSSESGKGTPNQSGFMRLRCTSCTTVFRTSRRRGNPEFEGL